MAKQPQQNPCLSQGWADFGQVVAIFGGIIAGIWVLYVLLYLPFERQKDLMLKLDSMNSRLEAHIDATRYYYNERK